MVYQNQKHVLGHVKNILLLSAAVLTSLVGLGALCALDVAKTTMEILTVFVIGCGGLAWSIAFAWVNLKWFERHMPRLFSPELFGEFEVEDVGDESMQESETPARGRSRKRVA